MKSEPVESPFESPTPDTASTAESVTTSHSVERRDDPNLSTPTIRSPPSSTDGDDIKKGKKDKGEGSEEKKGVDDGSNLVGRITNLVSTDLSNITSGRDFPMLFTSLPLQVILCIIFLYKVLGWSAIVGMVVMVALYPLPGWVASKMQDVQTKKMKMVSRNLPRTSRDTVSLKLPADGRTRPGCNRSYERHSHDQGLRLGEIHRRQDFGQA